VSVVFRPGVSAHYEYMLNIPTLAPFHSPSRACYNAPAVRSSFPGQPWCMNLLQGTSHKEEMVDWRKGRLAIRERIRALDKTPNQALWHQIENIWANAEKRLHAAQMSADGHEQGSHHSRRVEDNLSLLIPDDWKGTEVSVMELFVLSAAAALHDVGKKGDLLGDHGAVAARSIWDHPEQFGLDPMQAHAVGWLVYTHNHRRLGEVPREPYGIGVEPIRLPKLAGLFCLADTLHCDYTRVLQEITDDAEKTAKKNPVTVFRLRVSGCHIDDDGQIWITAFPRDLSELQIIDKGFQWIVNNEMTPIAPVLRDTGYPCEVHLRKETTYLKLEAQQRVAGRAREARAFPGLDFYREGDVFKGRELDVQTLYETVLVSPVSLLVGSCGVGKTSLACAGLFPRLRSANWSLVRCCPSSREPTDDLIRDIAFSLLSDESLPCSMVAALERLSERHEDADVLVFVDRFEHILRGVPQVPEDLTRAILGAMSGRFRNLHLLLAYRAEVEPEMGRLLQQLTGSTLGIPKCGLLPLTREGAREALHAGFDMLRVGLEPGILTDGVSLMDLILSDIDSQGKGFYPPYVQIVGKTLAEAAQAAGEQVITVRLYDGQGGAASIIGRYLFQELETFAGERELTESVLKALVRAEGVRHQKSLDELRQQTRLDTDVLTELLDRMSARRLIRPLEDNCYEIIHDFLAQLVVDELVGPEERQLRLLLDRLALKARAYASTGELCEAYDMACLYQVRDQIAPHGSERALLLQSCLAGVGPAWYWFKDSKAGDILAVTREAVWHPYETLAVNALNLSLQEESNEVVPMLKDILKDTSRPPRVKQRALQATADLRVIEALPEVVEALDDADWDVKKSAIEAIGALEARDALPNVKNLLDDFRWSVRVAAVEVIALLEQQGSLPQLQELLESEDPYRRKAALRALAKLEPDEALPRAQEMVEDGDWLVRTTVVEVLAQLKGQRALPEFRELLKDKEWAVRAAVVSSIAELGIVEALPELRQSLKDADWRVRKAATEALGKLALQEALPGLREAQKDEGWDVRTAAVKAVARLMGPDYLPRLELMLTDRDANKRVAAIEAITDIEGRDAVPKLKKLLRDTNRNVVGRVVRAIGEVERQEALPLFRDLLRGENLVLKRSACQAMSELELGSEEDATELARIVLSWPLADIGQAAADALVKLDRKLYCPFGTGPS